MYYRTSYLRQRIVRTKLLMICSRVLFTDSSLHVAGYSRFSRGSNAVKCVFCKDFHWLHKCRVITDPEARKEFLKKRKDVFFVFE